ncbi:MAG: hypothetical protein ACJ764_05525 [Solirubrobacteraceae bacterium]
MWFYPLLLILLLLGVTGCVFLGGVYTLVLVPLMVIGLGSALAYAMWARANATPGADDAVPESAGQRPLPHRRRGPGGHEPTSPEQLVEGRRQQQQVPGS